jgi:hypothetical protein
MYSGLRPSTEEHDRAIVEVIENCPVSSAVQTVGLTNFPTSVHTARRPLRQVKNLRNHSAVRKFRLMLRHTEARIGFALEHMLRDPHFSEHVVFGGQKVLRHVRLDGCGCTDRETNKCYKS